MFNVVTRKRIRSTNGPSTAAEDYLERILELINSKGYARIVDIAAALKISQASVTNMVQRLDGEGLLKYEKYRGLILTRIGARLARRSEEHTSELQSHVNLVCRLLLEKKKTTSRLVIPSIC